MKRLFSFILFKNKYKMFKVTQVSCVRVNQADDIAQYFAAAAPVYADTYNHYKYG